MRLHILTHLDSARLARLRSAIGAVHQVTAADSWADYERVIATSAVDLCVVDPAWISPCGVAGDPDAPRILARTPSVALVLYLTPNSVASWLSRIQSVPTEVVLYGIDDRERAFRQTVERATSRTIVERIVTRLALRHRGLAAPLQSTLCAVLHDPRDCRTATDMARAARLSRRSLYNALRRARLGTPHALLACAEVTFAFRLIARQHVSVKRVADQLHDPGGRRLRRNVRLVVGSSPSALRAAGADEVVRAVVRFAQHSGQRPLGCGWAVAARRSSDMTSASLVSEKSSYHIPTP